MATRHAIINWKQSLSGMNIPQEKETETDKDLKDEGFNVEF
jgi:hypothetical protein